ncbi:MAG: hypothetical protein KJS97_06450 [Alphaproteobacteria bacterium]|nr:hypothetical protein [Alphaproteobacteria bacterium]
MRRSAQRWVQALGAGLALAALAACVTPPTPDPAPASAPPPAAEPPRATSALLDFTADERDVEAIGARFAGSVTARYGPRAAIDTVRKDLEGQGFLCRDVPPVERRTDYLVAACEKPKPHGLCSDLFVISLRYAGGGVTNGLFVRSDGSFERSCVTPGAN